MRKKILKTLVTLSMATLFVFTGCNNILNLNNTTGKKTEMAQDALSGTYQNVVESYDWGPAVPKIIVHLDQTVTGNDTGELDESAFLVETTKMGYDDDNNASTIVETRSITHVYTCDSMGNQIEEPSEYIAIEMNVSPTVGSPFFYNVETSLNEWSTPFEQSISLVKDLSIGDEVISNLAITQGEEPITMMQASNFKTNTYTYGSGKSAKLLNYAYYENGADTGLMIWLHGSGEGGTDPTIALLGNKVANLASENMQNILGGCDILVAQCPNRWLNYQTGLNKDDVNTQDMYESEYTKALKGLIESYLSAHPTIDKNRIYIGGASNGGSMAMNMILNYPDYFAAAYFASEGYADRYISNEQIQSIKNIPMWFVYAAADIVNEPSKTSQATYERLVKAGARDVRLTNYMDGVIDITGEYTTDNGSPYQYSDHWSWVYVLNNDCVDNNVSIMEWLGRQYK